MIGRATTRRAAATSSTFPSLCTAATDHGNGKNGGVQRGMQRWVDEFVIRHSICPFAAKSDYHFHIYQGHRLDSAALGFFHQHVLETGERQVLPQQPRYSSFLVFPYVAQFMTLIPEDDTTRILHRGDIQFMGFYQDAIDSCENYAGTPNMTFSDQRVTVMPFHPHFPEQQYKMQQFTEDGHNTTKSEARLHTTSAPFPTFHILRDSDLNEVRKAGNQDRSLAVQSILKRNGVSTERLGLPKLKAMMEDYRAELVRVCSTRQGW